MVEPPWGVKPQTYALRGRHSRYLDALPAPTAPRTAPRKLDDLGERDPSCQNSCQRQIYLRSSSGQGERRIWGSSLTLDRPRPGPRRCERSGEGRPAGVVLAQQPVRVRRCRAATGSPGRRNPRPGRTEGPTGRAGRLTAMALRQAVPRRRRGARAARASPGRCGADPVAAIGTSPRAEWR